MIAVLIATMIVLCIINLMLLFFVFTLFKDNSALKLLVTQMHTGLGALTGRIASQESFLQKIGNTFSEFTGIMEELVEKFDNSPFMFGPNPKMGTMFRTIDGRYTAQSLEELIKKIKKDGNEGEYLSKDELEELRKMFEQSDSEEEGFDAFNQDDEDDDNFNPSEGKF